jgi:hypothetical protein
MDALVKDTDQLIGPLPPNAWIRILRMGMDPSFVKALSAISKQLREFYFKYMFELSGSVADVPSLLSQSTMLRNSLNYHNLFSLHFNMIGPFPAHLKWKQVSINALTYKSAAAHESQQEDIYLMIIALDESVDSPRNFQHTFDTIINNRHLVLSRIWILSRVSITSNTARYIQAFKLTVLHLKWCYLGNFVYEWTDFDSLEELRIDIDMVLDLRLPKKLRRLIICCHPPKSSLSSTRAYIDARRCEKLQEV